MQSRKIAGSKRMRSKPRRVKIMIHPRFTHLTWPVMATSYPLIWLANCFVLQSAYGQYAVKTSTSLAFCGKWPVYVSECVVVRDCPQGVWKHPTRGICRPKASLTVFCKRKVMYTLIKYYLNYGETRLLGYETWRNCVNIIFDSVCVVLRYQPIIICSWCSLIKLFRFDA